MTLQMRQNSSTIFIVGHARLPESVSGGNSCGFLMVELEVNIATGIVVDACCNALSGMGQRFLAGLLVGRNLDESRESAIGEIEERYFGAAKKAILSALENACERYDRYRRGTQELERAGL